MAETKTDAETETDAEMETGAETETGAVLYDLERVSNAPFDQLIVVLRETACLLDILQFACHLVFSHMVYLFDHRSFITR